MKVTVEVTQADLAEMGVSAEQLEDAVKQEVEGGLDVDGETRYINDADVTVVVVNGSENPHASRIHCSSRSSRRHAHGRG